jgi:D-glycero-alpha-D-manno-heptose-7-phosphate kinase
MRLFTFNKDGVKNEDVKLLKKAKRDLNDSLLLFYTGIMRKSSEVLSKQKAKIADNVPILKELAKLAFEGRKYLEGGEYDKFGELLDVGWGLKKRLASEISNETIDSIYQAAKEAGAIGGKISGAGAGGFLLLYCPVSKRDAVRDRLKHLRELPFRFQSDGSKVIFNYRG